MLETMILPQVGLRPRTIREKREKTLKKRKGSGRNEEEALLSQSLIFLVVLIQQKL